MSVTKERQETFYAKMAIKPILDGYAIDKQVSKSSIVNDALKEKFASLPQAERDRLAKIGRTNWDGRK